MKRLLNLFVLVALLALTFGAQGVTPAYAATTTLNSTDQGWYDDVGYHPAGNTNFVAGYLGFGMYRDFFIFDLSGISGSVTGVTLRVNTRWYLSPDASETVEFYDITTPLSTISDGTSGVAGYNDLGTGTMYGSYTFTSADDSAVVDIPLNANGIAAVNSALGGSFAMGGALATYSGGGGSEFVFGDSIGFIAQLIVTVGAPEASLSATSFDFGDVLVGQTSASQTLTITNTGDATLDFTGTSLNTHPPFNYTSTCGAFLNAGDSCTYEFSFTTYSAGLVNGDFTFTSNAAGSPHVISLSGNGVVVPPSGTNLLKKPDFATTNIFPTPWKLFGVKLPYASALDCGVFQLASCSVYFPSGNRSAMQQVNRTGLAGDMYLFGLSSMANNAGGKYLVEVTFYNNLNKPMGGNGMWFSSGTHGWQTLSGFATASGNYNKIIFRFYYQNPTGRAWFDDAFLMAAP